MFANACDVIRSRVLTRNLRHRCHPKPSSLVHLCRFEPSPESSLAASNSSDGYGYATLYSVALTQLEGHTR